MEQEINGNEAVQYGRDGSVGVSVNANLIEEIYWRLDQIAPKVNLFVSETVARDIEVNKSQIKQLLSELRGV